MYRGMYMLIFYNISILRHSNVRVICRYVYINVNIFQVSVFPYYCVQRVYFMFNLHNFLFFALGFLCN